MKMRFWHLAQAILAALIVLAFLLGAMMPPRIGLGYFLIVGAACIVAWRLHVGTNIMIPCVGAVFVLVLAFTPSLINFTLCTHPHICQTPDSMEAAWGLSLTLGIMWCVGLAAAFGLAFMSRRQAPART
ncbi:MAG: hypothetical protein M3Q74_09250 [Pseudomonadota bacterium]|nr:hypothetical protein [Pseudomonadota bacterium]